MLQGRGVGETPTADAASLADGSPARRGVSNSSVALERLRALLDAEGDRAEWRLPTERELAARIGVGRRAVRRALEVLEVEGRIWRRQGKGTFVGSRPAVQPHLIASVADRISPLEVMEARLQIEPGLASLAAVRASDETVAALERIARQTAGTGDGDARELWDSALHRRIAEAAGNGLLLALFDVVDRIRQAPSWRRLREAARTEARQHEYVAQHAAIVAAIGRHDAADAEIAMRRHLLALKANLEVLTVREAPYGKPVAAGDRSDRLAIEMQDGRGH
jgi:DNA-binding FadR family transcriptional regulator